MLNTTINTLTIDNFIVIKGGTYSDIKKALIQWIELYSKDLQDDFTFKLFKNGHEKYIIQADKRLDNERFYFLINYLNYPEGIEYKIDIEGFTTGRAENKLKNKNLLIYISLTDTDIDNVFVTTSDEENFKIDFGGKITGTHETKSFILPTDLRLEKPDIFTVNKKDLSKEEHVIDKSNIDKRFKFITLFALSLILISLIVSIYNTAAFLKFTFFVGMGISLWFFGDYKMLQLNKYYFYCLLISLAFLGYAILVRQVLNFNIKITDLGALYPLTLLVIQKPARLIYIYFLKREPVVDKPIPTFWDGVYTILLFLGIAVLPFIMMANF